MDSYNGMIHWIHSLDSFNGFTHWIHLVLVFGGFLGSLGSFGGPLRCHVDSFWASDAETVELSTLFGPEMLKV